MNLRAYSRITTSADTRISMRKVAISLLLAALAGCASMGQPDNSAAVAAAVADKARPDNDTARDAERKPAQTLTFTGVQPGWKVADFAAGSGYFTRLFGDVVGPGGEVYAVVPLEFTRLPKASKSWESLRQWTTSHGNISLGAAPAKDAAVFPEPLDLFWISQNYHDLHNKLLGPVDIAAFNRAVYDALKPGGVYVVLDHVAAKDAPADVTETLHRIGPDTVRGEVEAAGFKFEGASSILANPEDPHTASVFDPSVRGHTDQFIYKFRKPG
jgi:predicted methyltransferase